jgi:hypothetical protein
MNRQTIYLILASLGLVVPYWFLFQFMVGNGLNFVLLIGQLFANDISTFFAVDLIIAIIVFWIYMVSEARKLQMKNYWLYILASLTVGLSFALPLFLFFRERKLDGK